MAESLVTAVPAGAQVHASVYDRPPARELYIDRLRTVMTVFVILHHTAITYGAPGGWFYYELKPSASLSTLLLLIFVATNQAYFMGFFFLLAGYFTPPSLERKGYGKFLADRFLRLGVPLLAFIVLLAPLTVGLVQAYEGRGFWPAVQHLWKNAVIINGPLWFAQALLIFSLAYCASRAIAGTPLANRERPLRPLPRPTSWILSALGVGAAALLIRQLVPTGVNIIGLQLGYFASYVFLFALGIAAWRYDWLSRVAWKDARVMILGLALTWPLLFVGFFVANAKYGPGKANFGGGHTWPAILYAFWEPLVAWGLIAAWILVSRASMNHPSSFWSWLNRRAYAVFIIHPPVLVGVSLLLHRWPAAALLKFCVTGLLASAACWLLADLFVRTPGVRRIV